MDKVGWAAPLDRVPGIGSSTQTPTGAPEHLYPRMVPSTALSGLTPRGDELARLCYAKLQHV